MRVLDNKRCIIAALLFLHFLGIVILPSTTSGSELPAKVELLFDLPWGDPKTPTLDTGNYGQPISGPNAVALDRKGRIWILDNHAHNLLEYDQQGKLLQTMALPHHHHDLLAVAEDGSFVLVSFHLQLIEALNPDGTLSSTMKLSSLLGPPRNIGFGHDGQLEMVNIFFERFVLGSIENPLPLRQVLVNRENGPVGSNIQCGISVKDSRVELLQWEKPAGLSSGRHRPHERILLDTPLATSARILSPCRKNQPLFLHLEKLKTSDQLQVESQIVKISDSSPLAVFHLPKNALYVPAQPITILDDTVFVLHTSSRGLQLWKWTPP